MKKLILILLFIAVSVSCLEEEVLTPEEQFIANLEHHLNEVNAAILCAGGNVTITKEGDNYYSYVDTPEGCVMTPISRRMATVECAYLEAKK